MNSRSLGVLASCGLMVSTFVACSSFGSSDTVTSNAATFRPQARIALRAPESSTVEFVYVTNSASDNISAYAINPSSGALRRFQDRRLQRPRNPGASRLILRAASPM